MKRRSVCAAVVAAVVLASAPVWAQCAPDAVRAGPLCVDRYEASAWKISDTLPNAANLVAAVQAGMITSALQMAGAQRRGESSDDYGNCPDTGGGACTKVYAVSVPGVKPSAHTTWFQALAACTNSGKRLLTNQEWTAAALGSPDPGPDDDSTDCNSTFDVRADPTATGSRSTCVSSRGAYDLVGNLWEWVADWVPLSAACPGWGAVSNDSNCLAGASIADGPGALRRGGSFLSDADAGPLTVDGASEPSISSSLIGFRCAR